MAGTELQNLRILGILGQGGSGKTSLAEALLFAAGATQRLGRVQDGTSVFDHEPEEIKHQVSISTAFQSLPWKKHSLTLVDTPGYAAFLADSINCARAFGGAIFVLNPSVGLRVESERLWATANANEICRLLFVNKMDHEEADAVERMEPLLSRLDAKGVHLQLPIGAGAEFKGVVDLPSMKAYLYEGSGGKFSESEIPADLRAAAEDMRRQLMDSVAEADDGFLEKYLDGGEFSL
ncbi:MAG TPA: GTP-binding protein, partial [Candidatus Binatia bacterium]|nr:GTP-binding protein [Candidatus Binatia bacterium]